MELDNLNAWAERPNDGEKRDCWRCGHRFGPSEVYFYVIETYGNLPTCWKHVKSEKGPR